MINMAQMEWYDYVMVVLILAGAVNWGLVGIFDLDIVYKIFGNVLSKLVYIAVGIAGVVSIFRFPWSN
jgi:uncharacterized protein